MGPQLETPAAVLTLSGSLLAVLRAALEPVTCGPGPGSPGPACVSVLSLSPEQQCLCLCPGEWTGLWFGSKVSPKALYVQQWDF